MKKILTLALVGAMLTATGITAFAADPTTDVTYEVAPVYTVVIPESVTLGDTAVTETIRIYGADENSNVVIGKKQKVNVALTASANDFKVKTADGDEVAYTVNDKNAVDDLTTVAECTAADGKKNTTLTFAKTGTAAYAGTYTDTLTFTVSVETSKAAAEKPDIVQADCTFSPANGTSTLSNANITTSMEYSADNGTTWTDVTSDGSIASLAAGTVQIRVKETGDKLASEAVSITVPQVLKINELVGPYTGDRLTCEYYAGETWQALVDRYALIKVYSGRAAFGSDGFIYDERGSMNLVTDLVDNTKTYEVQ